MIYFKSHNVFNVLSHYLKEAPLIVEAGSFLGHDTLRMATYWPHGNIHAFEPVPKLYHELVLKVQNYTNIKTYQLALSDKTGRATIYVAHKVGKDMPTQASSLHEPNERLLWSPIEFPYTIEVFTITLDEWAKKHQFNTIDLLWLDLQGHELSALQGANSLLSTIKFIHAEVYFGAAYKNQPTYQNIIDMLAGHNFLPIAQDFITKNEWHFGNIIFKNASFN